MKKKPAKTWKTKVRLGPAGKGRRMGTEILGEEGYRRADEKKNLKKQLIEEKDDGGKK